MRELTISEVEHIAFALARKHLSFNEPIPDFSSRFVNKLESCLAAPFQKFSGKSLYKGLVSKASILLYLLIKNHPFQNGNKRIAITALLVFLHKNDKWLNADTQEFYNFTLWVAQSPAELKNAVVIGINQFIKSHLSSCRQ